MTIFSLVWVKPLHKHIHKHAHMLLYNIICEALAWHFWNENGICTAKSFVQTRTDTIIWTHFKVLYHFTVHVRRFYWNKMSRRLIQLEVQPIKQESDVPRRRRGSRASQERLISTIDLSSETEEEGKSILINEFYNLLWKNNKWLSMKFIVYIHLLFRLHKNARIYARTV